MARTERPDASATKRPETAGSAAASDGDASAMRERLRAERSCRESLEEALRSSHVQLDAMAAQIWHVRALLSAACMRRMPCACVYVAYAHAVHAGQGVAQSKMT